MVQNETNGEDFSKGEFSFNRGDDEKHNFFLMPDDYFETLAEKIITKIENQNEINLLSPTLSKIKKLNNFRVPHQYFEKNKKNIQTEIEGEKMPFTIAKISETGFKVPENYFELLPNRIREKIPSSPFKIIYLPNYLKKYKYQILAVAAAIAALIVYYYSSPDFGAFNKKAQFVSAEELTNSIYFQDIEESTIIEELNEPSQNTVKNQNIEIEDYLLDNHIDETIIINEL